MEVVKNPEINGYVFNRKIAKACKDFKEFYNKHKDVAYLIPTGDKAKLEPRPEQKQWLMDAWNVMRPDALVKDEPKATA